MLDRLQNPPLNAELNQHLIQLKSVNYPSITPTHSQEILKDAQALCALLGMRIVRPFSFNVESFLLLA